MSRNKYPVPSFRVLTETPVLWERGTRTEYTTEVEIPANRVYLLAELSGLATVENGKGLNTHVNTNGG